MDGGDGDEVDGRGWDDLGRCVDGGRLHFMVGRSGFSSLCQPKREFLSMIISQLEGEACASSLCKKST